MSDPFLGEIRMFAGNYAPREWALCDGQLMSIGGNEALFSLLGTIYGGDGKTTFALPDLRGRIPVHAGAGPGLSPVVQGRMYGAETITLTANQIPPHNHPLQASQDTASGSSPTAQVLAKPADGGRGFVTSPNQSSIKELAGQAVSTAGQNQSHDNMMPTLCVSFIISLAGIFPSRN